MFSFIKPKNDTTSTQELIEAANARLFSIDVDSDEYDDALTKIERLHNLNSREKEGKRVSPDTLVLVVGNLAGIVLILNYEKIGIVTSKAMSFVLKAR